MRRQLLIAGAALGVACVTVLLIAALAPPASGPPTELTDEHRDRRVSFDGYDSGVWPYLSSERSFRRTSPINVVVQGETDTVMRMLREGDATDFQSLPEGDSQESPGDQVPGRQRNRTAAESLSIDWESTEGATRYAYLDDGDGDGGVWVDETAQLQDGTYYGQRYHIRLYESPDEEEPWVAMQTHSEHFDWFTLRHEVHGTEGSQNRVEDVFFGDPRVDEVWRAYVRNDDSSDSDGWASMVVLLLGLSIAGGLSVSGRVSERIDRTLQRHLTPVDRRRVDAVRRRLSLRLVLLAVTATGILLGVRFAGIALEQHAGFLSMHAIAALLYPAIAVGIPVATYAIASGIEHRLDAAVAASASLAAGVVLDYYYVGIDTIPITVLVQRLAIILALGLIAAGAANRATRNRRINGLVTAGVVLWVALLAATLLEYI